MDVESFEKIMNIFDEAFARLAKEFGKQHGNQMTVFRIQVIPSANAGMLAKKIDEGVLDSLLAAYNEYNVYLFVELEAIDKAMSAIKTMDCSRIHAVGHGFITGTKGAHVRCDFTTFYGDGKGTTGALEIDGLSLRWLTEPLFTITSG